MRLVQTAIPEVVIVEPAVFRDDRGWFSESWNQAGFNAALRAIGQPPARPFVQDNHSCSKAGVLRGLHYQTAPHAQGKLVRVVRGSAFDVAVDIRQGSATFGRWFGATLDATSHHQMWIPPGFAHGFLALEDETHFLYKTTAYYDRDSERAIAWNDAAIGIDWPVIEGAPLLAAKDAAAPGLADAETFRAHA